VITASAAPIVLDATPAATPGSGTPAAPGFDSILMLQNLAGTAEVLDTGALEAADTSDLLGVDDTDEEEDKGEELEASLAFLSALIAATTPRSSTGDMSADSGGAGASGAELPPAPAKIAAEFLEAANQLLGAETVEEGSELTAGLTPVKSETAESRADANQQINRAADMLAQLQRQNALDSDKPVVTTHARDPRWADDFSNRISMLVRAGESTASLQMTPVDLGPVEVNVTVKDGQATIHFGASQAETRALLESSLPRLREMLASQGFNLLDASVSSGFSRSQHANSPSRGQGGDAGNEAETSTTDARSVRALGMLDLYA
jgi:flagellar hook-length control protein FliK